MGWVDRQKSPAAAAAEEGVRAFDQAGRELRLPRDVYWQQILAPAIGRSRDDAATLAVALRNGLNEGFATQLLPAAQRLLELEPGSERSRALLGMTQLELGDWSAAAATLASLTGASPWIATARHAQARIAKQRGEDARAIELLEAALAADPGHAAAFEALRQEQEERGGAAARDAWLDRCHAQGASWRASVQVAQRHVDAQQPDAAVAIARAVAARFGDVGDAIAATAKLLAAGGQARVALELFAERFDLPRHGPDAALALVRCCEETGDFERGRALLHSVALLPRPDLIAALDERTLALESKARAALPRPANPQATLAIVSDPLFLAGLPQARWLLPQKSPQGRVLAITPWVVPSDDPKQVANTAAEARFVRGAMALLAEQVWLHTAHGAVVVAPVVVGAGFVSLTQPLVASQVVANWPAAMRRGLVVVSGRLHLDGAAQRVDLEFFDAAAGAVVARAQAAVPNGTRADLVAAVDRELRSLLEPGARSAALQASAPPAIERQVDALSTALVLLLAAPKAPLAGTLVGERHLLRRLLLHSESDPPVESLDALFASLLSARVAHGSEVASEFVAGLREWFLRAGDGSTRARVAVAPLRALGLAPVWRARRAAIVAAAPPAARAWIEKFEGIRS